MEQEDDKRFPFSAGQTPPRQEELKPSAMKPRLILHLLTLDRGFRPGICGNTHLGMRLKVQGNPSPAPWVESMKRDKGSNFRIIRESTEIPFVGRVKP